MTQPVQAAKLAFSHVVTRTFSAIGASFFPFFLFTFVLSIVPVFPVSFALSMLALPLVVPLYSGNDPLPLQLTFRAISTVSSLFGWAGSGAVMFGALAQFKGIRADFAQCIWAGARFYLLLLALAVIVNFAMLLGVIALIVPGAMLATMLIAAGPAAVAERIGVFAALRRAMFLSEGSRWTIFFLIVAFLIVNAGAGFLSNFLARSVVSDPASSPATLAFVGSGIGALFGTIMLMIRSSGLAALYHELRTVREGSPGDELGQVFD
jgi:hypothetical protein